MFTESVSSLRPLDSIQESGVRIRMRAVFKAHWFRIVLLALLLLECFSVSIVLFNWSSSDQTCRLTSNGLEIIYNREKSSEIEKCISTCDRLDKRFLQQQAFRHNITSFLAFPMTVVLLVEFICRFIAFGLSNAKLAGDFILLVLIFVLAFWTYCEESWPIVAVAAAAFVLLMVRLIALLIAISHQVKMDHELHIRLLDEKCKMLKSELYPNGKSVFYIQCQLPIERTNCEHCY